MVRFYEASADASSAACTDSTKAPAITAAVVGVILNLAVWFGLHVVFDEVRSITSFGLDIDVPVWSTLNLPAAVLVLAALIAVFRFKLGPVTVLAGCAAVGLVLGVTNIA